MSKPLTIDAEFIICPDCQGLKHRIDNQRNRWACETCNGTGRIYFSERAIPWTETLREWWSEWPRYKKINVYAMVAFVTLLFGALAILNFLENGR